jgi:mannose-6-phosphate isomerase-like protein (cupin superfamily)
MTNNSLYNEKYIHENYQVLITRFYYTDRNNMHMKMHTHDCVEIMYVVKGSCEVIIDEKSRPMKNGDMVLLDANVSHRLYVSAQEHCRILNIEFLFEKKEGASGCGPFLKNLYVDSSHFRSFIQAENPYIFLKDTDEIYNAARISAQCKA